MEKSTTIDLETPQSHGDNTEVGTVDYSVFTHNQKRFIVFIASWAGFFSPVSSQIYFPALNTLAKDLNVSNSLINLTLTSYMVCLFKNPPKFLSLGDEANMPSTDFPRPITDVHRRFRR